MTVQGVKISQLPTATLPLSGDETVPIVQNDVTKKVALKDLPVKINYNWMGYFNIFPNGASFRVGANQRAIGAGGATFARLNFIDDQVTIFAEKGLYQSSAIRVQRDNLNANTASATVVMNLTQAETQPLLGKQICVQFYATKSSAWTGSQLNMKVLYSKEPQQPITLANGEYTNGNAVLAENNFYLSTTPLAENSPYSVTGTLPTDAVQVAIVFTIPWAGTANSTDYVVLEGCFLTIGSTPSAIAQEDFTDLLTKSQTRYQTTYPYGAPRGAITKAGSVRATAVNTSTTSAVVVPVRFSPNMVLPPQVLMQSPLSGTENRWENETTGVFVDGLPYNLSNTGVTLQNNGAVAAGDVLLCHWTARCVF